MIFQNIINHLISAITLLQVKTYVLTPLEGKFHTTFSKNGGD